MFTRSKAFLGALVLGCSLASGETVNTCTFSAPEMDPGESWGFTASTNSGPAGSAVGTVSYPYFGVNLIERDPAQSTGRFALGSGNTRYGLELDRSLLVFQSFISVKNLTLVSSNTTCPSAGSFNWLQLKLRAHNALRGAMDPSAAMLPVGGTLNYDPSATPRFSGTQYFDLAGPTVSDLTYSLNHFDESCTNGRFRVTSPTSVFDARGHVLFSQTGFAYFSASGTPQTVIAVPKQTLPENWADSFRGDKFSGMLMEVASSTSQTSRNFYGGFWAGQGTKFHFYENSDPTLQHNYNASGVMWTIDCLNRNSPMDGFCSGPITQNSQEPSGNAVCMLQENDGENYIYCAAQHPTNHNTGVTLFARKPKRSVVAVTVTPSNTAEPAENTEVTATIANLTGRKISLAKYPSMSNAFVEPEFDGSNGGCGATLDGFESCTVKLLHTRSSYGADVETYRVSYDNGEATVQATGTAVASAGMTGITVNPPGPIYRETMPTDPQNMYHHTFTATAHFTGGGTLDVTDLADWSDNSSSGADIIRSRNKLTFHFDDGGYRMAPTITATYAGFTSYYSLCDDGQGAVDAACAHSCGDGTNGMSGCNSCSTNPAGSGGAWGSATTALPYCCNNAASNSPCNTCSDGTTTTGSCTACGDGTTTYADCWRTCNGLSTTRPFCCTDGSSDSSCTSCTDGSSTKTGLCASCSNTSTSSSCQSCTVGTVGIMQSCQSCSNGTGAGCCGDGSAHDMGPEYCFTCGDGDNSHECVSCTIGTAGVIGGCTSCGDGTSTNSSCNSCDLGPTTAYSCQMCSNGTTSTSDMGLCP